MTDMSTSPQNHLKKPPITLQGLILIYAANYTAERYFHNLKIWYDIYTDLGLNLKPKQIRNALYRTRTFVPITHVGRGLYKWDVQP